MVDEVLVRELELYYENDYQLYQVSQNWVKNFKHKMRAGKYDRQLAIKGIAENFIPMVITKYRKEFSLPNVPREDKYALAARWVQEFEAEAKNESADEWYKKKQVKQ